MPDDHQPDEQAEKLSRAIVEAILKSREVRKAVRQLSEEDEGYLKSYMVLMLKVSNLVEAVETGLASASGGEEPAPRLKVKARPRSKPNEFRYFVDGRKVTPEEFAFCEYLSGKFDQQAWLKKLGIFFE
ncbi:MAG: hypothetical protein HY804_08495 [Nitrospinae bacterium]|nr:hypothetical protein [Nitrospinota bacterium]